MGVIDWVSFGGIFVDIVILSILISTAYIGYRKGLVSVLYKIVVFIASLFIVLILYKPVSATIINNTKIDEKIASAMASTVSILISDDGTLVESSNSNMSTAATNLIDSYIKEAMQKAESNVVSYVSIQLAQVIIRVITILILFIVSRILLLVIRFAAEIIANLPFIKIINRSGGLAYGIIKGFLIVYVILAVFSIFSPLMSSWGVLGAIENSKLGSKMYNKNIILNIVMK